MNQDDCLYRPRQKDCSEEHYRRLIDSVRGSRIAQVWYLLKHSGDADRLPEDSQGEPQLDSRKVMTPET